jgi:hypothetical protein
LFNRKLNSLCGEKRGCEKEDDFHKGDIVEEDMDIKEPQ